MSTVLESLPHGPKAILNLHGIIPPVITPLTRDETVDHTALIAHLHYLIEAEVSGVFMLGTAGEQAALTDSERERVVRITVEELRQTTTSTKIPILVGVMDAGTKRTIQNAQAAVSLGADAVVATLPYYYPTEKISSVVDHFTAIAEALECPVILYNIPQFTKSEIPIQAVVELSQISNIVAIKDSQEDWGRIQDLLFEERPDFDIIVGSEVLIGAALLLGATGGVLGIANIMPHLCLDLYRAATDGDIAKTFSLQKKMTDARRMYDAGYWLTCQKAGVSLLGFGELQTTAPIPNLSDQALDQIRQSLQRHGLL